MTAPWPVLLNVALRTSVVYFALLLGLRLIGARALGQVSPFDLVLLLVIANAVQNAMVGEDHSLTGGLVAAAVLIGWHSLVARLRLANPRMNRFLVGEGLILINRGEILDRPCRHAGVTHEELRRALREHGVASVQDVRLAVLEPDGDISVIRNDDVVPGTRPHHKIKGLRRSG
jgi:uncharacterized membrane protein YcaP (DUF421 family)